MSKELHNYYFNKEEPQRSCLLSLRHIILEQAPQITETQKYGMPCFCYYKNILCYLWTDKKTDYPYVLLTEGKLLDHPNLEQGNRSRMKIFTVDPTQDIPIVLLEEILQSGLDLYRKGIVKVKK
ncbi:DUF1801 domain-containing protein [Sphingobacterium psychroaquaticum]|uniref:YdhG-like domain-containing protein n=1 Tax=Sphingobacterium psychroaquaticum TaxID=561061 RepID=A0A1X7IC10_9SPHI|nr:DUF1801 domain-containing protein [Sphingobacterium psychroaquaticum]SMG11744.1 protein of unknown function (DU1801) [Sphingobacterium psychroaquaticum]